ncbi:hypothetical protein LTR62_007554 [Meristemomyces frigidus]|uniref:Tyrosine--tRNA ligase n=1 Tax=Meristemomyces frigidus TaxID=1508187 RepID=A0AAN7TIW6_9PEZI|nr:hypothetical protein LTR62_007554 [Meristemomyces frigidus]
MALKRKRSSYAVSSLSTINSDASIEQYSKAIGAYYQQQKPSPAPYEKPTWSLSTYDDRSSMQHLNSRTRKRHRDGRPDEEQVYASTIFKLYQAQLTHPDASLQSSHVDFSTMNVPNKTQKSTLHSFWQLPAARKQCGVADMDCTCDATSKLDAMCCEDCDATLRASNAMETSDERDFACIVLDESQPQNLVRRIKGRMMLRPVLRATYIRNEIGYICRRCNGRAINGSGGSHRGLLVTARTGEDKGVLALLEERGYVNQIAGDRDSLQRILRQRQVGFYAGIDPTAPSLHLGHLLPLMVLFWLYNHGHKVVSLVGGFTARVGDPSGRLDTRTETATSVHNNNFKSMFAQVDRLWDNAGSYGSRHGFAPQGRGQRELLNNATWLDNLQLGDFLQVLGHRTRIGPMLGRDTVRNKMEKGDGMTYSEFTYPLLQGWDWWHMYRHNNVQVQIGGSDQFGNIIAGMDIIKHIGQGASVNNLISSGDWGDMGKAKHDMEPMGLTVPLLTTASGEKFGKSAGNAIWLDQSMTSAFDLYGFLLRSSDDDVERYLKLFTFVPTTDIVKAMSDHAADPGKRKAQHLLAVEVLELVHGPDVAQETAAQHKSLRNPSLATLVGQSNASNVITTAAAERMVLPASLVHNTPFSRILFHAGIVSTKSEGARTIVKGGVYVAEVAQKKTDPAVQSTIEEDLKFIQLRDHQPEDVKSFINDGLLIFRLGKWKVRIVEVAEDHDFDTRGLTAPGWEDYKASNRLL